MSRTEEIHCNSGRRISVRIPESLADEIDAIARAEGVSVSEAVRAALYRFASTRPYDAEFKERMRQRVEEHREVLQRFAG
jgi:Arc/MetJ-type ribon-helix-helix transcriptional regulator